MAAADRARDRPDRPTTVVGQAGEQRAVRFLEAGGFRVVGRNVQTGRGEIDIIGWDQETLCFIEVKARSRSDYGGAQAAVDQNKQARLWKAAEAYLAGQDELWSKPPECRFDVVAVAIDRGLEPGQWHCELFANAFERGR